MACYNRQHTKVVFHLSSLSWAKPLEQGYSVEPLNLALKLSAIRQSSPEEEAISSFNFLFNFFVAIKVSFLVFCLFPAAFQLVKQQTQGSLSSSLPVILGANLNNGIDTSSTSKSKEEEKGFRFLKSVSHSWVICPKLASDFFLSFWQTVSVDINSKC